MLQLGTRSHVNQQARFELGFQDSEALGAPGLGLGVELGQDSEALGAPGLGLGVRSHVLHPRRNPGRAWACGPGGPCSWLSLSLGNAWAKL